MAYGNRKWRRKARRAVNRYYKRKAKNKQTVAIVKKVLHSQIENKQAFKVIPGLRVSTSFPASIAAGMYPIIPNLVSGLSGDNSKVGQNVRPLSLRLSIQAFIASLNDINNAPIYFDLYVFSIKSIKDSTLFDTSGPAAMDKFFRPSFTGVDTTYEGRVYNWFQNVNTDVINIIHKKRFKMSPTNLAAPGNNLNGEWVDNYSQYSINHTVPLSKHLAKTLKYTNATDELPNNCALFATMVCTTAQAGINPPTNVETYGSCSFMSCMVYEDA